MKFIDSTEVFIKSGAGGSGCVSFRSGHNQPKLGADGGDGGFGGNVYFIGSAQLNTLSHLRYKRHYEAENGVKGSTNGKTGRTGEDCLIPVPLGTILLDAESGDTISEVLEDGEKVLVAEGGKRGLGNIRFLSSRHQAPHECTVGGPSIEKSIRLELKLLADIGFAGLPNAGKSTLLSRLSSAKPKIADYPFTTLTPQLGVMEMQEKNFGVKTLVIADIPGLVEGASEGKGLGHAFLKHLERTRLVVYVLDAYPFEESPSPQQAFETLRKELESFSQNFLQKTGIIIFNKLDLVEERERDEHRQKLQDFAQGLDLECAFVSGLTGEGLSELKRKMFDTFETSQLKLNMQIQQASDEALALASHLPHRFESFLSHHAQATH